MFPEYGFLDLIAHYCLYRKKTLPHLMLGLRYDRHRMIHRQSEKKEKKSRRAIISEIGRSKNLEGASNRRAFDRTGFASKFDKMFMIITRHKGGLISESVSVWLKSKKWGKNHSSEHLFFRWIVLRKVTWHLFSYLSQSEKPSENNFSCTKMLVSSANSDIQQLVNYNT